MPAGSAASTTAAPAPLPVPLSSLRPLGAWQPVDDYLMPTVTAGQGLATVRRSGGAATLVYRGGASIPWRLVLHGWVHIGDPGGRDGYLVDAYQGPSNATGKLFELTTPDGLRYDFVHRLAGGEAANNSFATVSLDGRWLVSGEWETQRRLLVFPAPLRRGASGSLRLAGTITLDRPVRQLQGCDFATVSRLVCSSDDPGWPTRLVSSGRQLLQIDLDRWGYGARPTHGVVTPLGALPPDASCPGAAEVEGIDVDTTTRTLRVEVAAEKPCIDTTVYVYRTR